MDSLSLLALLKPTFRFIADVGLVKRLMLYPFSAVLAIFALERFVPVVSVAETADFTWRMNFTMLAVFVLLLLYLAAALAYETQRIVFFGKDKESGYYIPVFDGGLRGFIAEAFFVVLYAAPLAAVAGTALVFGVNYFYPIPGNLRLYAGLASVIVLPYFLLRFIFLLPARVAGKSLSYGGAWRATRKVGASAVLIFAGIWIAPLFAASVIASLAGGFLGESAIIFLMNFCSVVAALFSCVMQSAYLAYLYAAVVARN